MAVVYGFAGLRLKESGLYFSPSLPDKWNGYRFKINYEGSQFEVHVTRKECIFTLCKGTPVTLFIYNKEYLLTECITIEGN